METVAPDNTKIQKKSHVGPVKELLALGVPRETVDALAQAITATRLVHYAPTDIIYNEGTNIDALYVIRNGRIKLLNYLENGRARIVRLHNRGAIIGLNGLLDESHSHTAIAIDDVMVYQIPMLLIKIVKEQDSESYCELLEYCHEYLNIADTWITDFSTGAIRARIARLLLFLVKTDDDTGPSEVTLLTVEDMANILGVSPESVSRTMADFKRNKILQAVNSDLSDHYKCNMESLSQEAED